MAVNISGISFPIAHAETATENFKSSQFLPVIQDSTQPFTWSICHYHYGTFLPLTEEIKYKDMKRLSSSTHI